MAHSDEWVVDRQLVCTSFPHLGARSTVSEWVTPSGGVCFYIYIHKLECAVT